MPSSRSPVRLFVYGTLRRGASGEPGKDNMMMRALSAASKPVGRGRVRGKLHQISWYPALVDARNARSAVTGEVVELSDPNLLAKLDAYEDASTTPSRKHEYVRRRKLVTLDSGERIMAWAYVYNRKPKSKSVIASGDFLEQ
jgi:gamma-glutamylcyclotransferase (GGCT)/AIG2-like uncharacterized protein YtfP